MVTESITGKYLKQILARRLTEAQPVPA
jgi:hypothetical protein